MFLSVRSALFADARFAAGETRDTKTRAAAEEGEDCKNRRPKSSWGLRGPITPSAELTFCTVVFPALWAGSACEAKLVQGRAPCLRT